ncbi:MAG TPA: FAD-dependent oxidoreductase, partial [Vicinamibacterales bacterium]
ATWASAGILAPHIEGHGEPLVGLGVQSLHEYDGFIERVTIDADQAIEYQRSGTLQVALNADESQRLSAAAARLSQAHVRHELLDADAARRLEPALGGVASALHVPGHGYVGVRSLVSALVEALTQRGVTVGDGQIQDLEAERAQADAVIVAAGTWSQDLRGVGKSVPVRPIRGQLLHLRLPRPPASRVIWGERCYLVPWEDGSVLVGATSEDVGFEERATTAGVRMLLDRGTELLPELTAAFFDEVRVGLRPATPDELPIIGPSSTMRGVFYATGHYRNGVLLAPLTALAVADLVLEGRERPELVLVHPARFGL